MRARRKRPGGAFAAESSVAEAIGSDRTPHIGGGGRRTRHEMADVAMDELERFFRGSQFKIV